MRFRFSLRLFLIFFTLTAVLFGAATNWALSIRNQVRRHQEAVQFLKGIYCEIEVDGRSTSNRKPATRYTQFVRRWIDANYGQAAGRVDFGYDRKLSREQAILCLTSLKHVQGVDSLDLVLDELTPDIRRLIDVHRGLKSLYLTYDHATAGASENWSCFQSLESLSLSATLSDEAFISIAALPGLQSLTIDTTHLTQKSAEAAMRLIHLEQLCISGELKNQTWFTSILGLPKLESLTLSRARIDKEVLPALKLAKSLKRVSLFSEVDAPNKFFFALAKAPQLQTLTVMLGDEEEKFPDLAGIADCVHLRQIDFWDREFTAKQLLSLRKLTSLEAISFTGLLDKNTLRHFLTEHPKCILKMSSPSRMNRLPDGWHCRMETDKLICEPYIYPKCGMSAGMLESNEEIQLAEHPPANPN